jgi:hypothetical protein
MDIELLIILVSLAVIMVGGFAFVKFSMIKAIKTSYKQKEEIKKNNKKRTVEYLDTYFFESYNSGLNSDSIMVYHIVKDIDTKEIFAIDEVNSSGIRLEIIREKIRVLRKEAGNNIEISVGDKGYLWVDDKTITPKKVRKDNKITFGNELTYGGSVNDDSFIGLTKDNILYNINNKNNLDLFEKAKNVYGVLDFLK